MFGTRRLAKRSIVGTVVCCQRDKDGYYHSGTIQSIEKTANGKELYRVYFNNENEVNSFEDKELIGSGFQHISNATLKKGQQVYITHNSRETTGFVICHDKDIVTIQIQGSNKKPIEVCRKLDDVRLIVSRRSLRLQEHQCTNYNQLADLQSTNKTQLVSQSIDVPHSGINRYKEGEVNSLQGRQKFFEEFSEYDINDQEYETEFNTSQHSNVTDETMAAMILTSFSSSPASSTCNNHFLDKDSSSQNSMDSSGVWGMEEKLSLHQSSTVSDKCYSFEDHYSSSAPTCIGLRTFSHSLSKDEGIDICEPFMSEQIVNESRKRKISTERVFKCLWPDCEKIYNTCSAVEKHVRDDHLETKQNNWMDHEEEFYYTEVEFNVDTVTQTFADMWTVSPIQQNSSFPFNEGTKSLSDHDYQKKSLPVSIPKCNRVCYDRGGSLPASLSVPQPIASRSSSWQNNSAKVPKINSRQDDLKGTTPTSCTPKKIRSESKKCRKYYGMENRDLWCTQCKWKKACTRFMDYYNYTSKIQTLENCSYYSN